MSGDGANEEVKPKGKWKGPPGSRFIGKPGLGKGKPKPPRLLRDMRAVYEQTEEKDRGEGQRTMRKVLKEDPKGFLSQMAALERAHMGRVAAAVKKESGAPSAKKDEATQGVVDLIDRLLEEASV